MKTFDVIAVSVISLNGFAVVAIGGLFYPNTLAYKVSAFIFSLTV